MVYQDAQRTVSGSAPSVVVAAAFAAEVKAHLGEGHKKIASNGIP